MQQLGLHHVPSAWDGRGVVKWTVPVVVSCMAEMRGGLMRPSTMSSAAPLPPLPQGRMAMATLALCFLVTAGAKERDSKVVTSIRNVGHCIK